MKTKRYLITLIALSSLLFSCGIQPADSSSPSSISADSSSSESSSQKTEMDEAVEAANELIASINLDDYISPEREEIEKLIAGLNNLVKKATSPEQIYAAIKSIQEYLAFAKTKAQHEEEAEQERLKELAKEKERLLKVISVERPNRFRKEELDIIRAEGESLRSSIEAASSLEELQAISFANFNNLLNNSKTNAEYVMEEWYNFPIPSKWDLVNQHTANWVYENSTFATKGLGADDVGYMISSGTFSGDLSFVLRSKNTANASQNYGFLIGNMNPVGNGFDGYLINYDYASDHQYLQIWYFENANAPEAATVYEYIGGWIYNNQYSTTLNQDDVRVIYDGEFIHLMNNNDYLEKDDLAYTCTVDLKRAGKYAVDPNGTYSIGFFNWDGTNLKSPRVIELKEFITEEVIVGSERAALIADKVIAAVDLTPYEEDEQALITAKGNELKALYATGTYAEILAGIQEFKDFVANTETHEQKELDRHPDISTEILDNIYSGDSTKYTASNWALVNEHALAWAHTQGSHSVVTDGLAGYCMDAATHANFTLVFKVTGVRQGNPYPGNLMTKGLILGGSPSGDYFNGVFVSLSNDWGLQFYTFDGNPQTSITSDEYKFLGGIAMNMEGVTMRFTYVDNAMSIYMVNADGSETRMSGTVGNYKNGTAVDGKNVWDNLNIPAGHFGIFDWGDTGSTFEILEYRDL